jgi:hypothetical protein
VGLQQRPDRRLDGPEPAVHLHRRRLRREVHGLAQDDRRQNGSSTETKKDFIVVNPFPVASATTFGAGSTVPAGVPGPMQMPASATPIATPTRAASTSRPDDLHDHSFNVPNEPGHEQSVWFFTYPGTTPPSSYAVTAADTKFIGSGPTTAALNPTTPDRHSAGHLVRLSRHLPRRDRHDDAQLLAARPRTTTTILGAPDS